MTLTLAEVRIDRAVAVQKRKKKEAAVVAREMKRDVDTAVQREKERETAAVVKEMKRNRTVAAHVTIR